MKSLYSSVFLAVFSSGAVLHAELPLEIKHTAENYNRAMEAYDANVAAIVKADRDAYLIVLTTVRKREEGAKRLDAVAAIDAEIKAVHAGVRSEKTPVHLPDDAARYRTRYITAPDRAAQAVKSVRCHTREEYLKWLAGMAEAAGRVKNAELAAAIAQEQQRVRAAEEDGEAEGKDAPLAKDTRRAACWQNIHNIGVACLSHSAKHGGAYPNSLADLVKSGELSEVPVSPFAEDKASSSYDLTMPGFPGVTSRDAARTIVVRCKFAGPDGNVSAGFADGHVASVPADALSKAYGTAKSNLRKWSDPTGKYSTEATFAEFVAGGVSLQKTDGKIITVPYPRLSRVDLDYLQSLNVYVPE